MLIQKENSAFRFACELCVSDPELISDNVYCSSTHLTHNVPKVSFGTLCNISYQLPGNVFIESGPAHVPSITLHSPKSLCW